MFLLYRPTRRPTEFCLKSAISYGESAERRAGREPESSASYSLMSCCSSVRPRDGSPQTGRTVVLLRLLLFVEWTSSRNCHPQDLHAETLVLPGRQTPHQR